MLAMSCSRGNEYRAILLDRREELGRCHVEPVDELDENVEPQVSCTSLEAADVGPVETHVVSESLL